MIKNSDALEASKVYFAGDELAADVFVGKYALRDNDNNLLESTPEDMHRRLAKEFARIEKKYPNPLSEDEIFGYFDHFKYLIPQGSPMSAIGNPFQIQSISNCFVIPSPHDSYAGILTTDQQQAQIMKRRGGVGFDISNIRPKGSSTLNAAKTTDGIGVFMERFSNTCREVAQNGRRGALMLSISVHHPEIQTFIDIKKDKKKVTGANISIRLSDEFMNAVEKGEEVELRWPVDSKTPKIRKMVDAKKIWLSIVHAAWFSAEPGLLFWDNVLKYTPADIYAKFGYRTISTNPCVSGDTIVQSVLGPIKMKDLFEQFQNNEKLPKVWSFDLETNIFENVDVLQVIKTKENANVIKINFEDGTSLKLTPDHRVLTKNRGYVEAAKLQKDDDIISYEIHTD